MSRENCGITWATRSCHREHRQGWHSYVCSDGVTKRRVLRDYISEVKDSDATSFKLGLQIFLKVLQAYPAPSGLFRFTTFEG